MSSFFSFFFTHSPFSSTRPILLSGPLTRAKAFLYASITLFFASLYLLLITLNATTLVTVPSRGGTLRQGIIGAPRFINPVLAQTDSERSISALVFAGLMKELPDGTPLPDLAQSYEVSADERTYTFILKDNITFQDHTPLTSHDILFTLEKLRSASINPAGASYWQQLLVSSPDERTIIFTLPAPDSTFLSRASFGILPHGQWESVPDEAFTDTARTARPIGAGAFVVSRIHFDKTTGSPNIIRLSQNKRTAGEVPLLSHLVITTYANQTALTEALENKTIDMTADISAETLERWDIPKTLQVRTIPTGRAVVLYRLSNEPLFSSGLSTAITQYLFDKQSSPATIEDGYDTSSVQATVDEQQTAKREALLQTLAGQGYRIDDGILKKGSVPLSIAIATVNSTPELIAAARQLSQELATIGIVSEVQVFDLGTFQEKLEERSFPFVLVSEKSMSLPSGYSKAVSVYEQMQNIVARSFVGGVTTDSLRSARLVSASADTWHVATDRIWKWFIKK